MKKLLNLLTLLTLLVTLVTPAFANIRVCEGYECLAVSCDVTTGTTTDEWIQCTPEQESIINEHNQLNSDYCAEVKKELNKPIQQIIDPAKPSG